MSQRTPRNYGALEGKAPRPSPDNLRRGYAHIDHPGLDTATPRRTASMKRFEKRFKKALKKSIQSKVGDEGLRQLATLQNIRRHQSSLHSGTQAVEAMGTVASALKQIPEPHVQTAGRLMGAATTAVKAVRVASDFSQPQIRAEAEPMLSAFSAQEEDTSEYQEL